MNLTKRYEKKEIVYRTTNSFIKALPTIEEINEFPLDTLAWEEDGELETAIFLLESGWGAIQAAMKIINEHMKEEKDD